MATAEIPCAESAASASIAAARACADREARLGAHRARPAAAIAELDAGRLLMDEVDAA